MEARWIRGHEGLYDINPNGLIRRHFKNGAIKTLKATNVRGYSYVVLCRNGEAQYYNKEMLIEETFPNGKDDISQEASIFRTRGAWMDSPERKYYKQLNK